ncbi:hypothetical protein TrVE_jg7422 [Triparma verrucosa]|uniref:Uncharacterized protein n=1 Tax=Triparma verrucosa TaxID=1606542 RepID=A0A9W7FCW4_9STRA|nr:hypothetical protein TrVE_jg7422 [Triparma verrucosa]
MRVERQDEAGVIVSVESVEVGELEAASLPNPHSTASKKLRLLLKEGMIILRPLPFGQTSLTISAHVDVGEVTKDAIISSPTLFRKSPASVTRSTTIAGITSTISSINSRTSAAAKMVGAGVEAAKAKELFYKLAEMFYERFKREDVIDGRRKADFIKNGIPNVPPLTEAEENLIAKSMRRVNEKKANATRVCAANDTGGIIPTWVVDKKMPNALLVVQDAINDFRQDDRIDAADREDISALMEERWGEEVYSEEEIALLQRVRQKFEDSLKEGKWTHLKSPDVFVEMESIFEDGGSSAVIGRASTIVDASIEDCAASEWMRMSRGQKKVHYNSGGLDRAVVNLNNHNETYHLVMDFGVTSFAPREWLTSCVWKKEDENNIIVGVEDVEDANFPPGAGKGYVRASSD